MKKGLKFVLALTTLLVAPITLTSCGETTSEVDENQDIVNAALTNLSVQSTVTEDFTLTVSGIGGATISWTSNNSAITIDGSSATVTRSTEADVTVILTATATKGSASGTRDFTVTVSKISTEYISISEVLNSAVGTKVTTRGVVTQIIHAASNSADATAFYLFDGNAAIYVKGADTANAVKQGQEIILSGEASGYFNGSTLDRVVQIYNPDVNSIVVVNESANTPIVDKTKFETQTVAGITADIANKEAYVGKAYLLEDVRINYYDSGSYISMSVFDWSDNPNYSSDPAFNLYASSGNNCEEYAWLSENYDKKVDVIFAIEGVNSRGTKFRGAIMAVLTD